MALLKNNTLRLAPRLLIVPSVLSGLVACAPMQSSFKADEVIKTSVKAPPPIEPVMDKLTCLNEAVDFNLTTNVVDFHMTDSRGVKVGAKVPISGIPLGIDLGVTYSTGELHTAMHLSQPLYGATSVSDKQGTALNQQIGFNADFGIQIVNLGFSYLTTTPIGKLSQDALTNNLQNIMADIKTPWSTHISAIYGADDVEIPVGLAAGLRAGDEFHVYDVSYRWAGEPCESHLLTKRLNSPDPIATLVVSQASSPTTTILSVKEIHSTLPLAKYQQVVLSKPFIQYTEVCKKDFWGRKTCSMQPVARAALKRSIRIAEVSGEPIYFNLNGATRAVDVTKMMNEQLKVMLNSDQFGFYLKP